MEFTDKYISESENAVKPDLKKILISNDAFAVGEILYLLHKALRRGI